MNGYLNTVIVTVTVCQIAQMIVQNTESYKRIVHIMCALVLVLIIARPIGWVVANIDRITETVQELMISENAVDMETDSMEMTAQAVMEHAVQAFSLESEGMRITLITDEDCGGLTEIQLYVRRCSYADRERAAAGLTKTYGIPVYIYSDRSG